MTTIRFPRQLAVLLGLLVLLGAGSASAEGLSFAVVPQQSATKIVNLWTPVLTYLGEKSGLELKLKTAPDIPTFEKRLIDGEYDFAYMNPYHYTVAHQKPGYRAFAKQKDKRIKGIIVVRKDSPIKNVDDLHQRTLAFPSPAAFAASVLPRAQFPKMGIDVTPRYVSSHDSVYQAVARGLYPAGGGVMRTFNNTAPQTRAQLRILWTTKTFPPHAFAAHPRVAPTSVKKLQDAMLTMTHERRGQQLLQGIRFKGLETAQDSDWDDVRELGITLLDKML